MMSKSQPTRNGTPQVQSALIIAIVLFAFSGLMVGFAVGAFVRPARPPVTNTGQTHIVVNHPTPTSTPDPTPTAPVVVVLGCPTFSNFTPTTNADGTVEYNVTIQARDKAGENGGQCNLAQEKPITAPNITCRIWLVPQTGDQQGTHFFDSAKDQLRNIANIGQPFPQEVQGGLVFDPPTTNEVQTCMQGTAQWKFTIAPSVHDGKYYLVALTDWQGQTYNWSWESVVVGKQNQ